MNARICPQCHSLDVHRSRRRGFVERFLLALIFKRPFRCDKCKARYYGYVYSTPLREENPVAKPQSAVASSAAPESTGEAREESAVPYAALTA